jgi:hypothetical protein
MELNLAHGSMVASPDYFFRFKPDLNPVSNPRISNPDLIRISD